MKFLKTLINIALVAILFINLKAAVKDIKQIITFFNNIWLKMTEIFMFKAVEQ